MGQRRPRRPLTTVLSPLVPQLRHLFDRLQSALNVAFRSTLVQLWPVFPSFLAWRRLFFFCGIDMIRKSFRPFEQGPLSSIENASAPYRANNGPSGGVLSNISLSLNVCPFCED